MTLHERVQAEMTAAMRSGDAPRRDTLRLLAAALYNAQKAARHLLTDDEALAVITREVKLRRESIEAYEGAGRPDLAAKEHAALVVIGEFLPRQLDEAELLDLVREAIAQTGASGPRDLGKVMAVLAPRTRGRADGRAVSALVGQELARSGTPA
ncbi:MAG: GatB/YqeY domain-containing protein [Candidatus Limnocylindrales bacterium]